MIHKLGTFGRSIAARIGLSVAAVVLMSAGGVMASASPAAAAEVPVFIRNTTPIGVFCLDQHYDAGGNATTTVFAWKPCHTGGSQSPGNQLWRWEHLGGNIYRVTVKRGNFTWCLSAPNGDNSRVYAEYCVWPVPPKQKWQPVSIPRFGVNQVRSLNTSGQCMRSNLDSPNGGIVTMSPCVENFGNQHWTWSP